MLSSIDSLIASIAFPTPARPKEFYDAELISRNDFVWLTTSEQERIPAVFVKPAHKSSGITIIYSHGNAEDIALNLQYVQYMANSTGCNVLSYEYVGYSLSKAQGATPSEVGCLRSIDSAWRHVTETLGIPAKCVILFGRSIGSGPTVDLASRKVPTGGVGNFQFSPLGAAGVVLHSPLASGAKVILGQTGLGAAAGFIPIDIFPNYSKIQNITSPVAIMHGTNDEVVPFSHGQELFEKLQRPFEPLWMEGRGHNDMPENLVLDYATRFIYSVTPSSASSSSKRFSKTFTKHEQPKLMNISKKKVRELRSTIEAAGLTHEDCIERSDLQERYMLALQRLPAPAC